MAHPLSRARGGGCFKLLKLKLLPRRPVLTSRRSPKGGAALGQAVGDEFAGFGWDIVIFQSRADAERLEKLLGLGDGRVDSGVFVAINDAPKRAWRIVGALFFFRSR